jgi:hypothetical protein
MKETVLRCRVDGVNKSNMSMMTEDGMRVLRAERDPESGREFQRGKKRCLSCRSRRAAAQPQRLAPLPVSRPRRLSGLRYTDIKIMEDLLKKQSEDSMKDLSPSSSKEDLSSLSQSPSPAPPLGHDPTSGASSAPSASSSRFEPDYLPESTVLRTDPVAIYTEQPMTPRPSTPHAEKDFDLHNLPSHMTREGRFESGACVISH